MVRDPSVDTVKATSAFNFVTGLGGLASGDGYPLPSSPYEVGFFEKNIKLFDANGTPVPFTKQHCEDLHTHVPWLDMGKPGVSALPLYCGFCMQPTVLTFA